MNVRIIPRKALWTLLIFTAAILIASILVNVVKFQMGDAGNLGLIYKFFDLNNEKGIPTMYSEIILLISSLLLFLIGLSKKKEGANPFYEYGLSIIFLFLSIDEFIEIHEHVMDWIKDSYTTSGVFYHAWVIPYGILVIVLGLLYLRYVLRLPKKTMYWFMLSGAVYILGVIGFEVIGGWYIEKNGEENGIYTLIYHIEELLEMVGIILFIYSLLQYITDQAMNIKLSIEEK